MERKPYPSDVTDQQWALVEPLLPRDRGSSQVGRPRKVDLREVVNALFYHAREGCSWRALPHDFPPWKTVYNYFMELERRRHLAKTTQCPSHSGARSGWTITDPQPPRRSTANRSGPRWVARNGVSTAARRYKAGSCHILVDSLGFLIAVVVTAANVDDARAAQDVFAQVRGRDFPRLQVVFADARYHNHALDEWLTRHRRPYRLEIVSRAKGETRFQTVACALGRGADVFLARALPVLEQRLRAYTAGK